MKTKLYSTLSGLAMLLMAASCQSPDDYSTDLGVGGEECFQSFKAYFTDEDMGKDNEFLGEIDYDNHTINVVFPYNYPRNTDVVLSSERLTHVRVVANLLSTVTMKTPITHMDLTQSNRVVVADPYGTEIPFTVTGEIRKSNECAMLEFALVASEVAGIINPQSHVITLPVAELPVDKATYRLSHGATISPDPSAEEVDFADPDLKFTVTAQNGVDKTVYTVVQGEAEKVPAGLRPDSEKLLWAKRMADIGLSDANVQSGIAILDDVMIVNEIGTMSAPVLSIKTGEVVGHMDLSGVGAGKNSCMTADDAGHILVSTQSKDNDGTTVIWMFRDINSAPEQILSVKIDGSMNCGFKVAVTGDVTKQAVVTAPISGTAIQFCRWAIDNGNVDYKLETAPGWDYQWGNVDVVWGGNTLAAGEYFVNAYAEFNGSGRGMSWQTTSGQTKGFCLNTDKGAADSGNWCVGGVDYVEFNKSRFAMFSSVNIWTWGFNDRIKMLDLSGGSLDNDAVDFEALGINSNYGANAVGNTGQYGAANGVALHATPDGYYLYMGFQFAKGYVGCLRADCIKM